VPDREDSGTSTKCRIGPLHQGKPTHRTNQDVVPTPRVGVGVGLWLELGFDASVRVIRRSDAVFRRTRH